MPVPTTSTILIRRYPNRRFYDTSRSGHVTLEEIRNMVADGCSIHVEDSKTGEDITAKVLIQVIMEYDAPKLDILPCQLLSEIIRSDDSIAHEYIGSYFSSTFRSFQELYERSEDIHRHSLSDTDTANARMSTPDINGSMSAHR